MTHPGVFMLDVILLSGLLIAINVMAMVKLGWHFFKPYYKEYMRKHYIKRMLKDIEKQSFSNVR